MFWGFPSFLPDNLQMFIVFHQRVKIQMMHKNKRFKSFDFPLKEFFVKIFADKVFVVGGTIRDFLLYNRVDHERDIDLVVVDHNYEEIEKKLRRHGKTNTVGKSFAVVKFTREERVFDISVPRKDVKASEKSHSHKNFIIEQGAHITLEEDLKRRDFTCNSIALRLLDNQIVDPFGGMDAIGNRRILMTGPETFFDDPLRILRGARFASVHQFLIAEEIYHLARPVNLGELSMERIQEELFRLLLESPLPSFGLQEYFKLAVLEKIFPSLYDLTLTMQDSIFHPEIDEYGHHTVWAHTIITVDICSKLAGMFGLAEEERLVLLLAALLHDVGKADTTRWEFKRGRMTITSLCHDTKGADTARHILGRLKVETRNNFPLKQVVVDLIKNHHRLFEFYRNQENIGFKSISRLIRDLDGRDLLLVLLDFADRQSRETEPLKFNHLDEISQWYLDRKEELSLDKDSIQPLIQGRDLIELGIAPGKAMGNYLKRLYDLQLDGEFKTRAKGLKIFQKIRSEK